MKKETQDISTAPKKVWETPELITELINETESPHKDPGSNESTSAGS